VWQVPGLFEGDEYTALLSSIREAAGRENFVADSEDELFRWFTARVQRNLHIVFTMNPASADFGNRVATSPALFNRCVVNWMGDWSNKVCAACCGDSVVLHCAMCHVIRWRWLHEGCAACFVCPPPCILSFDVSHGLCCVVQALAQVADEFTTPIDMDDPSYRAPRRDDALEMLAVVGVRKPAGGASAGAAGAFDDDDDDDDGLAVPRSAAAYSYRDAVVASLVRMHRIVGATSEKLGKRAGRRTFVCPRDYLDFIQQYRNLYDAKRRELEDQQLHLNVGLDKLRDTQAEVAEMSAGLLQKEKELTVKSREANDKLQRMVTDQKDAEANRAASMALGEELAKQNEMISARRSVAEADLSEVRCVSVGRRCRRLSLSCVGCASCRASAR
jgi:hypothetical protein